MKCIYSYGDEKKKLFKEMRYKLYIGFEKLIVL